MRNSTLPADLKAENVVAVVDTREQRPWDLSPLQMVDGTLPTADYSVLGLENHIAIERKSLSDFLGCVGVDRERFEREVQRLLGYETRAIVIETDWQTLVAAEWRSKVTSAAAIGSVLSWMARGIPVVLAGDREWAAKCVGRLLYLSARRRYREARALVGGIVEPKAPRLVRGAHDPSTINSFCPMEGA